jgi:Xaa-Pro aminopeptidase
LRYLDRMQPLALLVLRIVLGAIFIGHGYPKVFQHLHDYTGFIASMGMPGWLGYVSAFTEFGGGILLIVGALTRFVAFAALVERQRMIKDADELAAIRAAVDRGAALFDRALQVIRPGVSEVEVAAEMEYAARKGGADGMSFETIIASGPRSALPHGRASSAPIVTGGFVVCDFGVILHGYCSDRTRTVYVGAATAEARRTYDAVLASQHEAIDAVRPGVQVGQVDRAARKALQKKGLGKYFTHSTGHGVGLEIHEAPRVAKGQTEVLRPGMVITIEPGVYLPEKWGVRIEDMVVVTERGCEVLTPTQKEFIVI